MHTLECKLQQLQYIIWELSFFIIIGFNGTIFQCHTKCGFKSLQN